jgi:conjugative relaxase-like TrwC/TraI family protein
VVASISARGGVQAAVQYYAHLGQDDYYLRDGEPPGGWAGEGAARLSLAGPVTKSEFEAALKGIDPKTGERLAALGGRLQDHAAGWDITFSAPKSVSVLWALSEGRDRPVIESAHRAAVSTATRYLEQTARRRNIMVGPTASPRWSSRQGQPGIMPDWPADQSSLIYPP